MRNSHFAMALACACASCALSCAAITGFDEDYDAALARAKAANRQMIVLFTGSDWCIWCKRLEEEVLSKPEFLDFATNQYELVMLDYPRDKTKQSAARRKRNSELSEKFGVDGYPTVKVVDSQEKELYSTGYARGGAKAWIEGFGKGMIEKPLFDKHLAGLQERCMALGKKMSGEIVAAAPKDMDGDVRKWFLKMKEVGPKYLGEMEALRDELAAKKVPDELTQKKADMTRYFEMMCAQLKWMVDMDVDEAIKEFKESRKRAEDDAPRARAHCADSPAPARRRED